MTPELTELIAQARVVVWDFDGPICRLFTVREAERVAAELVARLARQGLVPPLTDTERATPDPQLVLRAVARRHPGDELIAELEEHLTQEELRAVSSAFPTPFADPLIRTWTALGARMAIATDNSPRAVTAYLAGRGVGECFAPHIYGRTQDFHRLKPDPHGLGRALHATGAAPDTVLALGGSPGDVDAARAAGVPFLGYARDERKAGQLREAGAPVVVRSLESVLLALRTPTPAN